MEAYVELRIRLINGYERFSIWPFMYLAGGFWHSPDPDETTGEGLNRVSLHYLGALNWSNYER